MKTPAWAPSFIGIGAEKSATTWCWSTLDEHPEVCMSQPKELNYFNSHYERGASWYQRHFAQPERRVQGEISPHYMDAPAVCQRIAKDYPAATILVVLRNPYERAMSHLAMDVQNKLGGVSKIPLERWREVCQADEKFIRRSLYHRALSPYFEHFAREQIAVLYYEDLQHDAGAFARRLYEAVGANPDFSPSTTNQVSNKTQDYWSPALFRTMRMISRGLRAFPPTRLGLEVVYRKTRLRENTIEWLMTDADRPRLPFEAVFGVAATRRIAEDRALLVSDLRLQPPPAWSLAKAA